LWIEVLKKSLRLNYCILFIIPEDVRKEIGGELIYVKKGKESAHLSRTYTKIGRRGK
jgi:hypothetical protein